MLRNAEQAEKARPRRVGLVVVHGVGETEPGYCLDAVVGNLQSRRDADGTPQYEFTDYSDYERLPEIIDGKVQGGFPVFRREGLSADGTRVSAVELHWADTTVLQAGRLNTLLAFFGVIFESQHLVHAMLERGRDVTAKIASHLLLVAAWLLRGPIAGLTIAVSAFCMAMLFVPDGAFFGASTKTKFILVQSVVLGGAILAFWHFVYSRQQLAWYDLIFWSVAFTLSLIVLDLAGVLIPLLNLVPSLKTDSLVPLSQYFGTQMPVSTVSDAYCGEGSSLEGCYVGGPYKIIIWLWRVWGILLLVCVWVLIAAALRASRKADRAVVSAIATSIGILVMQFLLWTTVVVSVLYPMLNRAEGNAAMNKLLAGVDKPALAQALKDKLAGKDPIYETVNDLFALTDVHPDWIFRFKFIYVAATMTLMLVAAGAWVLMSVRRVRARSGLEGLSGEALNLRLLHNYRRMPKLLFNSRLVALLIWSYLMVMFLVFVQPIIEFHPTFAKFREIFLPSAAIIALLVPMVFGPWITNVVHIARDLIDHHYQPRLETAAVLLPDYFKPPEGRPRRQRIHSRLVALLDRHVRDGDYDDIIFLAHSQGSVVVYDYLRAAKDGYAELGGATPSFITCGSPLGTIYQSYFYEYGRGDPVRASSELDLKCWINLFRVEDYIGGPIAEPRGVAFKNQILPPGEHRHMFYWGEVPLGDALDALIRGVPMPSLQPVPEGAAKRMPRKMPPLWNAPEHVRGA